MKFVTLYDSKAFIPEEKGRPLALTSWLKATLLLCCEKTKSPIVKEVSRSSTAAGKSLWRPPFTSTVVPTFPPVVAAFYENSSSPTTVYYLRFSCGVSRALFASLLVLFFAEDLLRRRVCRKKREKKDAIWPNGTWYSLLMKPPWREKWVLKVYNIKFPDSLDAQSNSACASEPPWPPTFFITPSIPRATTISLQLQWSPLGEPFWSIFIQLEANFPRPVSAFFQRT